MFERITKIDNSREADGPREKHVSIEMTDQQHREKLEAMRPTGNFVKFNNDVALLNNGNVGVIQEKPKRKRNERKKSKNPMEATKKNRSKSNSAAVETVQEKL